MCVNCVVVLVCAAEAPQEPPPVEEGGLEGESWAKPLTHLWQSRPPNLKKEREYNQRMCSKPPYCSICMLFYTYQQVFTPAQTILTSCYHSSMELNQHLDNVERKPAGVIEGKKVIVTSEHLIQMRVQCRRRFKFW